MLPQKVAASGYYDIGDPLPDIILSVIARDSYRIIFRWGGGGGSLSDKKTV